MILNADPHCTPTLPSALASAGKNSADGTKFSARVPSVVPHVVGIVAARGFRNYRDRGPGDWCRMTRTDIGSRGRFCNSVRSTEFYGRKTTCNRPATDVRYSSSCNPRVPGSLESSRSDDSNDMRDHGWYTGAGKVSLGSWTIRVFTALCVTAYPGLRTEISSFVGYGAV